MKEDAKSTNNNVKSKCRHMQHHGGVVCCSFQKKIKMNFVPFLKKIQTKTVRFFKLHMRKAVAG